MLWWLSATWSLAAEGTSFTQLTAVSSDHQSAAGTASSDYRPSAQPTISSLAVCNSEIAYDEGLWPTVSALRAAYQQERYLKLEAALHCLMREEVLLLSGHPGAAAAYWLFRKEIHGKADLSEVRRQISSWEVLVPGSDYVAFAKLRLLYAQAWAVRGNRYASKTSQKQFQGFYDYLMSAERAIMAADDSVAQTPLAYNLFLATVLDARQPVNAPQQVFRSAIDRWPHYYDFYEVMLTRLVPKWGGSWRQVDEFIEEYSGRTDDDSLYARLYYSVHRQGAEVEDTLMSWPRMRESLKSLVMRYPTDHHRTLAARYACYFRDVELLQELVGREVEVSQSRLAAARAKAYCQKLYRRT